jgi:hypothetical protein
MVATNTNSAYILSKRTHVAAVERTLSSAEQVRGTAGVELAMAKKKVKKSDSKWIRCNAGMVKLYLKAEAFVGVGIIGAGYWQTLKTYSFPVTSWGTSNSKAIANCVKSSSVDLPVNAWLYPDWSMGVADVYANMASDGYFYIKLNWMMEVKKFFGRWSIHPMTSCSLMLPACHTMGHQQLQLLGSIEIFLVSASLL